MQLAVGGVVGLTSSASLTSIAREPTMPTQPKHDAIALLKADHRKLEDLFEKFENARSERKQALMEESKNGAKLRPPETRSFTGHELVQGAPVDAGAAG